MKNYEGLLVEFKDWLQQDNKIQMLWNKASKNTANYKDAENYAKRIGMWWSNRLSSEYGEMDYTTVVGNIEKSFRQAYSNSAYYSKNVQKTINDRARIGMNVLEPAVDEERLQNLLTKLIADDAGWLLEKEAVENFTRSAVTDTIQANARIQSEAGLHAYVVRDAGAGCCEWCSNIAGTYDYGDQSEDFWRVHKGCTCTFSYKPSRKKAVEHIRYITNANGTLTKETTIS